MTNNSVNPVQYPSCYGAGDLATHVYLHDGRRHPQPGQPCQCGQHHYHAPDSPERPDTDR